MLSRVPAWKHLDREDPYYRIELTVEGHAAQHEVLWQVFGRKGDYLAMQGLRGYMKKADIIRALPHSRGMLGKKHSAETRAKMSQNSGPATPQAQEAATAAVRKPVLFEGVSYPSISKASQVTGHCRAYIRAKGKILPTIL